MIVRNWPCENTANSYMREGNKANFVDMSTFFGKNKKAPICYLNSGLDKTWAESIHRSPRALKILNISISLRCLRTSVICPPSRDSSVSTCVPQSPPAGCCI